MPAAPDPLLGGLRRGWRRLESGFLKSKRRTAFMEINDRAPEFTLPDENGKPVSLAQYRGKNVVLYFFPKADTPG
jgi:cytochrome oxidase Cu insertion factor (SCO1/SenC/PrrC family)